MTMTYAEMNAWENGDYDARYEAEEADEDAWQLVATVRDVATALDHAHFTSAARALLAEGVLAARLAMSKTWAEWAAEDARFHPARRILPEDRDSFLTCRAILVALNQIAPPNDAVWAQV